MKYENNRMFCPANVMRGEHCINNNVEGRSPDINIILFGLSIRCSIVNIV